MTPKTKAEWLAEAKRCYVEGLNYYDAGLPLTAVESFTQAGAAAAISAAIPNTQPARKAAQRKSP